VLQFAPPRTTRPKLDRRQHGLRDEEHKAGITRIWNEQRRVYGADEVWAQLRGEGVRTARCTLERVMRDLGIRGLVRGKTARTTGLDEAATRSWSIAGSVHRRRIACGWPI
jgi:transposase InsO family protein